MPGSRRADVAGERATPPLLAVHLLLALFSAPLLFWRLGAAPLLHGDESLYLAAAFDSFGSGPRWIPSLDGDAFLLKAPLSMWLISMAQALIGPTLLAGRLASAIAAFATVFAVAHLAGRLFRSHLAALLAGLVLLFNPAYLYTHCARWAEPDALAILFFTLTALAYDLASERRSVRWLFIAGACAGLCAMAKSLLVGLLPLAAVGLADLLPGRRFLGWWRWSIAGAGLLVVVLPWHLSAWSLYGQGFLDSYLFDQTLSRMDAVAGESRWGLGQVQAVFHGLLPFTLAGLCLAFRTGARQPGQAGRPALLLLTWVAVMALALCTVNARLPWYVLPAYPALAILTAGGVLWVLRRGGWWLAFVGGAALISAFGWRIDPAFDPFAHSAVRAADDLALVPWAPFWSLALLAGIAALVALRANAPIRAAILIAPAVVVMAFEAAAPLLREINPIPINALTAELGAGGHLTAEALYLGPVLPSAEERTHLELAYAAAGGELRIADDRRLLEESRAEGVDQLIVPSGFLAELREELADDWRAISMARTACAQYGAQPDWMVVLARGVAPLRSADPEVLFAALSGGTDAERVSAAARLAAAAPAGAIDALLELAHGAQGSPRLAALEALARLSGPGVDGEVTRALGDLLRVVPPKGIESMLLHAALARCGDAQALQELRSASRRRSRVALRDPVITRLLFVSDFAGTLVAVTDGMRLRAVTAHHLWRGLGAARVWAGIDELSRQVDPTRRALVLDLLGSTDGRVVRSPPDLKKSLGAMLDDLAQTADDAQVRSEALALSRLYHPGVWVAWVPSGVVKKQAPEPVD